VLDSTGMKKLIEYGRDHHPATAEAAPDDANYDYADKEQSAWAVAIMDDCEACDGVLVELTLEEVGRPGYGQVAHLSPADARQLAAALTRALKELGEER
jgi:hypothetical protein